MRAVLVRFVLVLVLLVAAIGPAPAGDSRGDAVRAVISQQLEAFQRDDGEGAFSFASPTIRQIFGTPERFMDMVRSGYRAVYRPQVVEFQELFQRGTRIFQNVFFVGPDGRAVIAEYEMQRQPDGSWKINGVRLGQAPDAIT